MPRKTPVKELISEEAVTSSPLRRSTRLSGVSSPSRVLTRRSSASDEQPSTITRSRRLSYNDDTEKKEEETKVTTRGRRASISSDSGISNKEEDTAKKSARATRSASLPKEQLEVRAPITRRRSSVTKDSDEEMSSGRVTRSRLGSRTKATLEDEQSSEEPTSRSSTPVKKTATAPTVETLEPIKEDLKEEQPETEISRKSGLDKVKLSLSTISESEDDKSETVENKDVSQDVRDSEESFHLELSESQADLSTSPASNKENISPETKKEDTVNVFSEKMSESMVSQLECEPMEVDEPILEVKKNRSSLTPVKVEEVLVRRSPRLSKQMNSPLCNEDEPDKGKRVTPTKNVETELVVLLDQTPEIDTLIAEKLQKAEVVAPSSDQRKHKASEEESEFTLSLDDSDEELKESVDDIKEEELLKESDQETNEGEDISSKATEGEKLKEKESSPGVIERPEEIDPTKEQIIKDDSVNEEKDSKENDSGCCDEEIENVETAENEKTEERQEVPELSNQTESPKIEKNREVPVSSHDNSKSPQESTEINTVEKTSIEESKEMATEPITPRTVVEESNEDEVVDREVFSSKGSLSVSFESPEPNETVGAVIDSFSEKDEDIEKDSKLVKEDLPQEFDKLVLGEPKPSEKKEEAVTEKENVSHQKKAESEEQEKEETVVTVEATDETMKEEIQGTLDKEFGTKSLSLDHTTENTKDVEDDEEQKMEPESSKIQEATAIAGSDDEIEVEFLDEDEEEMTSLNVTTGKAVAEETVAEIKDIVDEEGDEEIEVVDVGVDQEESSSLNVTKEKDGKASGITVEETASNVVCQEVEVENIEKDQGKEKLSKKRQELPSLIVTEIEKIVSSPDDEDEMEIKDINEGQEEKQESSPPKITVEQTDKGSTDIRKRNKWKISSLTAAEIEEIVNSAHIEKENKIEDVNKDEKKTKSPSLNVTAEETKKETPDSGKKKKRRSSPLIKDREDVDDQKGKGESSLNATTEENDERSADVHEKKQESPSLTATEIEKIANSTDDEEEIEIEDIDMSQEEKKKLSPSGQDKESANIRKRNKHKISLLTAAEIDEIVNSAHSEEGTKIEDQKKRKSPLTVPAEEIKKKTPAKKKRRKSTSFIVTEIEDSDDDDNDQKGKRKSSLTAATEGSVGIHEKEQKSPSFTVTEIEEIVNSTDDEEEIEIEDVDQEEKEKSSPEKTDKESATIRKRKKRKVSSLTAEKIKENVTDSGQKGKRKSSLNTTTEENDKENAGVGKKKKRSLSLSATEAEMVKEPESVSKKTKERRRSSSVNVTTEDVAKEETKPSKKLPVFSALINDKLEKLLERNFTDDKDEEDEGEEGNEFISSMAEEGEEDTPSEGSNDIIDIGDAVNTDSERSSDEDDYDCDSFIDDDESYELLSGEEYDLLYDSRKDEKSTDYDDDVFASSEKKKTKKKIRILKRPTEDDSTDAEADDEEERVAEMKREVARRLVESNHSVEVDGLLISPVTPPSREPKSISKKIIVHQNVRIQDVSGQRLSDQIHKVLNIFCPEAKKNQERLRLDLSLDFAKDKLKTDGSQEDEVKGESLTETVEKNKKDISITNEIISPRKDKKILDKSVTPSTSKLDISTERKDKKKLKKDKKRVQSPEKSETSMKSDFDISGISDLQTEEVSVKTKKRKKKKSKKDVPATAEEVSSDRKVKKKRVESVDKSPIPSTSILDISVEVKDKKKRKKGKKRVQSPEKTETSISGILDGPTEKDTAEVKRKKKNKKHVESPVIEDTQEESKERLAQKRKSPRVVIRELDDVEETYVEPVPTKKRRKKNKKSALVNLSLSLDSNKEKQEEVKEIPYVSTELVKKGKKHGLSEEPSEQPVLKKKKKKRSEKVVVEDNGSVIDEAIKQKRNQIQWITPSNSMNDSGWEVSSLPIIPSEKSNNYVSKDSKSPVQCSKKEKRMQVVPKDKDFKNQMLYDPDRVKRVHTKLMLTRRGAYTTH